MDLAYNKGSLNITENLVYKFDIPASNIMVECKKVTASVINQRIISFSFS